MGAGARRRRFGWPGVLLRIALVAGAYTLGAELGLRLAFENRNVTPVWPPTGIALAALLVWGYRVTPGIAIGAVIANYLNNAGIEASLGIAFGNTLAPALGAFALKRLGLDNKLARVRDVLLLVFVGGFLAMTISASAGTGVLLATRQVAEGMLRSVWLVWWVGDAIGVVLFTPFLILLPDVVRLRFVRDRPLEALGLLGLSGAAAYAVFNAPLLLPYVAFIPVVWAALRFERVGAACVTVIISVIAVIETVTGRGPFTFLDPTRALVSLQTFNASIALTALLLAAVRRERRNVETALRTSEELYRKLFEEANDFVCIHDVDGRVTFANAAAERLTGFPRERLHGMTIGELVAPEYVSVVRRMTHRQFARRSEPLTYEIDVLGTNGRRVSLEVSSAIVQRLDQPATVQLIGRDVTSRRMTEERLRQRALQDELTGLPNETLLRERLQYALALAEVEGTSLALLLVDLDGFGRLNQTIGSQAGDDVLRAVGAKLRSRLRHSDTVARLRGDEFGVLLAPIDGVEDATAMAKQLIDDVAEVRAEMGGRGSAGAGSAAVVGGQRSSVMTELARRDAERDMRPAATIGIALFPGRSSDVDAIFKQADLARHVAEQSGPGSFEVYGPQHDPSTVRRLVLQDDLLDALKRGHLYLLFQPKIDIQTMETVGVECFARWTHPRHGLIADDELRQVADGAGLTDALTEWTIKEALRRRRIWMEADVDLLVSVNVSASDLARAGFVESVRALIDRVGVPASALVLEIDEPDIMDGALHGVIGRLGDMGISIAIDRFGSGYSSLVQLRRLRVTEIKIDRALVAGLAANDEDRAITHSIVQLGHNLGVRVVADGIQGRETWAHLLDLGCDLAQGPLICQPVPQDELESWLRTPAWSARTS